MMNSNFCQSEFENDGMRLLQKLEYKKVLVDSWHPLSGSQSLDIPGH